MFERYALSILVCGLLSLPSVGAADAPSPTDGPPLLGELSVDRFSATPSTVEEPELNVRSVEDAVVLLDGEEVGRAPLFGHVLTAGTHRLTLRAEHGRLEAELEVEGRWVYNVAASADDWGLTPPVATEAESDERDWRACAAASDQRCVVEVLGGHAEDRAELVALLEAYEALGFHRRAVALMRRYVERWGDSGPGHEYRMELRRTGEEPLPRPTAPARHPSLPSTRARARTSGPSAGRGTVHIEVLEGARIIVDGRDTGLQSPQRLVLPAGEHRVELRRPRRASVFARVRLAADEEVDIALRADR